MPPRLKEVLKEPLEVLKTMPNAPCRMSRLLYVLCVYQRDGEGLRYNQRRFQPLAASRQPVSPSFFRVVTTDITLNTYRRLAWLLALLLAASTPVLAGPNTPAAGPDIQVYFSPEEDCTAPILGQLNAAARSIRVKAYVLTSDAIAHALTMAHQRGVDVQIILDHREPRRRGTQSHRLAASGIPILLDGSHHQQHNKVILIDDAVIITGSFNFSVKAENENAENLLIIRNTPHLIQRFQRNWLEHASHSRRLEPPATQPAADDDDIVYVTRAGERYHRKACRYAETGAREMTREQARTSGKAPCKYCKPDDRSEPRP
jgi:phosphatidylserine/phosphatidylglycerophosphate/cardiolipin synthase-like enzyme